MAVFNQFFPNQNNTNINPEQFKNLVQTLDKTSLQQLVMKAKQQGISDADIENGLNYILNLR